MATGLSVAMTPLVPSGSTSLSHPMALSRGESAGVLPEDRVLPFRLPGSVEA